MAEPVPKAIPWAMVDPMPDNMPPPEEGCCMGAGVVEADAAGGWDVVDALREGAGLAGAGAGRREPKPPPPPARRERCVKRERSKGGSVQHRYEMEDSIESREEDADHIRIDPSRLFYYTTRHKTTRKPPKLPLIRYLQPLLLFLIGVKERLSS